MDNANTVSRTVSVDSGKRTKAISARVSQYVYNLVQEAADAHKTSMAGIIEEWAERYANEPTEIGPVQAINNEAIRKEENEPLINLIFFMTNSFNPSDTETNTEMLRYNFKGKVLWTSEEFRGGCSAPNGGVKAVMEEFGIDDDAEKYEFLSRASLFENEEIGRQIVLQEFFLMEKKTRYQWVKVSRGKIVDGAKDIRQGEILRYLNVVDELGINQALSRNIDKSNLENELNALFKGAHK